MSEKFYHQHGGGPTVINDDLSKEYWQELLDSLSIDHNIYAGLNDGIFGLKGNDALTLNEWSAKTGQDKLSSYDSSYTHKPDTLRPKSSLRLKQKRRSFQ